MVSVRVPAGDSLGGAVSLHDSSDDSNGSQGHLLAPTRHAALHYQHQLLPPLHMTITLTTRSSSLTPLINIIILIHI